MDDEAINDDIDQIMRDSLREFPTSMQRKMLRLDAHHITDISS